MTLFAVRDFSWSYPGSESRVFDRLNLKIPKGQTVALLGPSGSGKTTLMQILGLLWDSGKAMGEVTYFGLSGDFQYGRMSPREKDLRRETDFGFALQNSYILPQFSCWWNIALPLLIHGYPEAEARKLAEVLLAAEARGSSASDNEQSRGSLWSRMCDSAREFSQGQRQRLAVLRAIISNPQVIFADEPTSNLDPVNSKNTVRLLKKWKSGELEIDNAISVASRSLLVVTHNLQQAYEDRYLGADHFIKLSKRTDAFDQFDRSEVPTYGAFLNRLGAEWEGQSQDVA